MTAKNLMYNAYEISCLMDSKRVCSDLLASLLRLNSAISSHYISDGLYDKSQATRKAVEDLVNELQITLYNIEDGYNKKEN